MSKTSTCPSEAVESRLFETYLASILGCKWTHIPNEHARTRARGVSLGVPDYMVVLPNKQMCFVELKRQTGGRLSPDQKEWLEALNSAGVPAVVALGAEHAASLLRAWCTGLPEWT